MGLGLSFRHAGYACVIFANHHTLGAGEMKVVHLGTLVLMLAWTTIATAKIPEAVVHGFRNIYVSLAVFFVFAIASVLVGGVVARRAAPTSRDKRQLIMGLINVCGIAIGGFVAFKVAH